MRMLTVEKVRLWNITKDGEPCALKGASTVRGGGHAMPTGLTVPTLLLNGGLRHEVVSVIVVLDMTS